MGLLGVPLNVGTAPVASIALGIAVDDTVHFLEEYRAQRRRQPDPRTAILAAVAVQARPVVYVSIVLAMGFGVLALSNFGTVVRFGVFSAFVMLMGMACELLVTPVVLSWLPARLERAAP
jgi:predicted RND superfamily exporter protein